MKTKNFEHVNDPELILDWLKDKFEQGILTEEQMPNVYEAVTRLYKNDIPLCIFLSKITSEEV